MTRKKLMMSLIALSVVFALTIGGTLAFLQDTAQATNTVTIGNVEIDIEEPNWPEEPPTDVEPGQVIHKDPLIHNTGRNAAFVRIFLTGNWEDYLDYIPAVGDGVITNNQENWGTQQPWLRLWNATDGSYYYYFYRALEAGESTPPLFTSIRIKADLTEVDVPADLGEVDLIVNAQAIQTTFWDDDGSVIVRNAIEAFDLWVAR
jgi:alternate signal-mediated exported protein